MDELQERRMQAAKDAHPSIFKNVFEEEKETPVEPQDHISELGYGLPLVNDLCVILGREEVPVGTAILYGSGEREMKIDDWGTLALAGITADTVGDYEFQFKGGKAVFIRKETSKGIPPEAYLAAAEVFKGYSREILGAFVKLEEIFQKAAETCIELAQAAEQANQNTTEG